MNSGNIFDEAHKGSLLFHYTSLNSAIAILSTQSLLFGSLSKLNDMNESWRPIMSSSLDDGVIDACEKELESYVQISLTCEDSPEEKNPRRGFDIATMWGHYAEGGNGVCLALNKDRFIEAIGRIPNCHHGYVHYRKEYDSAILFESTNPEDEILQHITNVFFCKSDQWQYEQEYRIVKKASGTVDRIDLTSCLEGIIYARLGATREGSVQNTRGHWALDKVRNGVPLFGYIPRNLDGSRSIISDDGEKTIWSTGKIIDLFSGEYVIDYGSISQ